MKGRNQKENMDVFERTLHFKSGIYSQQVSLPFRLSVLCIEKKTI